MLKKIVFISLILFSVNAGAQQLSYYFIKNKTTQVDGTGGASSPSGFIENEVLLADMIYKNSKGKVYYNRNAYVHIQHISVIGGKEQPATIGSKRIRKYDKAYPYQDLTGPTASIGAPVPNGAGYTLTATNIVDGGVGVRNYYWATYIGSKRNRVVYSNTVTTIKEETKAIFFTFDLLGNPGDFHYDVTVESDPPDLGLPTIPEYINGTEILKANPTDEKSDLKSYYWTLNGVQQPDKEPQIVLNTDNLNQGNNTISFYASDVAENSDSSSFTIFYDSISPILEAPYLQEYREVNNEINAVFYWSEGSDPNGSGIKNSYLEYYSTRVNTPGEVLIPLDDNYGNTITLTAVTEDNAGNVTNKKLEYSFPIPVKLDNGYYQDDELETEVSGNDITYKINLPLTYAHGLDFRNYIENRDNKISYTVSSIIDGVETIEDIDISKLLPISGSSDVMYYSYAIKTGTSLNGKDVKYIVQTKYNNVVIFNSELPIKVLPKTGSKPEIKTDDGNTYLNRVPVVLLTEKGSTLGVDLDGYEIKYKLHYKKPGNSGFIESSIDHDITTNVLSLIDRDGNSIFTDSGVYSLKIVSEYSNQLIGSEKYSSNVIEINYDTKPPLKPQIILNNGATNLTNNSINITVNNIQDMGDAGVSNLVIRTSLDGVNTLSETIIDVPNGASSLDIDNFEFHEVLTGERKSVTLSVESVDRSGNSSDMAVAVVDVDKEIPLVSNAVSISTENSITFTWDCLDQAQLQINNGDWLSSTENSYLIENLELNSEQIADIRVKDAAGNISEPVQITAYTLDVLDIITDTNIRQEVDNNKTFIYISFPTTLEKSARYLVSTNIEGSETILSSNYSAGVAQFAYEYSQKVNHDFKINIMNSGGIVNEAQEQILSFTPVNNKPLFTNSAHVKPEHNGFSDMSGYLEWPAAIDYDTDDVLLKYIVSITPDGGQTIVYDPVTPLTDNRVLLSTLLGNELVNNKKYSWSVIANDNFENSLPISNKIFKIDGNNPVVNINNLKVSDYTKELIFNIVDSDSGLSSVKMYVNDTEFTNYSVLDNDYIANLTNLTSGLYSFKVISSDRVGNRETTNIDILYDTNSPEIVTAITPELESTTNEYIGSSKTFSVNFSVLDDFSGVENIYYGFSPDMATEPLDWVSANDNGRVFNTDNREVAVNLPVKWELADGVSSYLFVKVIDKSGHVSQISKTLKPIYFDSTPPILESVELSGLTEYNNSNYLEDISTLVVNAVFKDTEEQIINSNYRYILKSVNNEIVLKEYGNTQHNPVALTDGELYTLTVYAKNRAETEISTIAGSFIYDSLSPLDSKVTVSVNRSYIAGSRLKLLLEAKDSGSGIISSNILIGTEDGLSDIGNEVIAGSWQKNGDTYSNAYAFNIPDTIADGNYFITALFKDALGKSTVAKTNFVVDNVTPTLSVSVSPFTSSPSSNSAKWDFNREDIVSEVYYRLSGDTGWTSVSYPDTGNIINFSNSLTDGLSYFIEVKVVTTDNREFISKSNDFLFDSSQPNDLLTDEESWPKYVRPGELKVRWNISDNESGISGIKHRVEILNNSNWSNLTDWIIETQLRNLGEINFSNLGLKQSDQIRVRRVITNGVGSITERTSPIIVVDNNIPEKLTNIYSNAAYLKTSAVPKANWINTEVDNESGMKYYWVFKKSLTNIDAVTDWIEDDGTSQALADIPNMTIKPQSGETWFFIVKGVNGVGMETYGYSSGITFDDLAPDVVEVSLIADNINSHIYYLNDQTNLMLNIEAFDNSGSTLSYNGDFGYFNNLGEYLLISTNDLFAGNSGKFSINTSQRESIVSSGKTVFFRASVADEAGNITGEGFSPGTVFDNVKPQVINESFYISNGYLYVSWDGVQGNTNIKEYRLTLKRGSTEILLPSAGIVNQNYLNLDVSSYTDGVYTLSIEAVSESGLYSSKVIINEIVIDNNKPLIENITTPNYVYKKLKPEIRISESGSGIADYKYAIGTASDPVWFTSGWIEGNSTISEQFNPEIDLSGYITKYSSIPNGETIYLTFMVKDYAGNWSAVVKSSGVVLDKTTPESLSIEIPQFSNKKESISSIKLRGIDQVSGIDKIELTLFEIVGGNVTKVATITENTANNIYEINSDNYLFNKDNLVLKDNCVYRLGYRLANGAGIYSDTVYSGDIKVDLTFPEILFTTDELVFNENLLPVSYSISEEADLILELVKDNVVRDQIVVNNRMAGSYSYIFDHKFADDTLAYGNYILRGTLTDKAGNTTSYENSLANSISIRFNEPPYITFDVADFETTPGKPYTLKPLSVIDNDDDISQLAFSWTLETLGNSDLSTASELNPEIKFYHADNLSTSSRYKVILTVTDPYGKSTTKEHYVTVENTRSGQLYHQEFWRDTHYVDGDITIPSGITLNVVSGTNVEVSGEYGIYVEGTLDAPGGSIFTRAGAPDDFWSGICIKSSGTGNINNTNITKALRGVAILYSGSLTLTDSNIEDNVIGIHAYNSNPNITNSVITNNSAYGLKEDGISNPVLTNTQIIGNTLNIYDSVNTIELGESR